MMERTDDESLIEQITVWHENEEHDSIIETVLKIPEEERGYELTCLLARAYNNTEEYEKALDFLLSIEDEGKYDLMWHFRIGYAYYYLEQLEAAEKAFVRVLESDSGNSDAQDFLGWIREEIEEAIEIKPEQEKAALEQMIQWLSHENELGGPPAEIEPAGEFDLHGYHYYIYKYKKTQDEPWLLGVCGGYGRRDLDHCGHVFSEMEEYHPETAEADAIALVEMIRTVWMEEAQKELETRGINPEDGTTLTAKTKTGPFAGFVLLNSYDFDPNQIKANLKNDWNILVREDSGENPDVSDESTMVFEVDGMTAAITLIDMPVPNGEAEYYAKTNYMWPEAPDVTKTHVAHLLLAIIDRNQPPIEAATLYTKIASSCLKLENAIGIYTSETVFQPEFYIDVADLINEGDLPILNWIYFGIYTSEKGTGGYTYGLRMFGKEEIEIINSTATPETIHDLLIDVVYYVLSNDITLEDGETIGFTEYQKLKVKKSKGVALDGYTLKIEY
ncbi:uncharacterized protein DUF4261 [Methanimicrococcus blatticola]|uniref:Uncharacterized protein DUF4261 n=2 Tax=Methanimicrococcus blatticola TaxID=91560 RepID=A0A484F538_9EURY|nr:uncharacterized protein DUF4261 [Methanimicrococcus blatticola]